MVEKKKKIVFVINTLKAGGAERVFWLMSNQFSKKNYAVSLIVINNQDSFFNIFDDEINLIDLQSKSASSAIFRLIFCIKKINPSVVFTTGTNLNIIASVLSIIFWSKKFIAREPNVPSQMKNYVSSNKIKAKILFSSIKFLYPFLSKIICQSESMKDELMKTYKLKNEQLAIIENPVVENNFLNELTFSKTIKLVTIGRFSAEKGQFRMLEILKKMDENFSLDLYGKGILENDLKNKIKELNLEKRVKICGECKNSLSVLKNYDCTILTSYTEGFPNVLVESLSVGTPVVAFKVSGAEHIIDEGKNGYCIKQNDDENFQLALKKIHELKFSKSTIKEKCLEKFSIQKIFDKYEKLVL
jgi:glycosyltransferase involved in cell wall biosynthesis